MKLAIISDLHLGFGRGTQRENESYENAAQAFELALEYKADAILLAGDIFDEAIPSQETWQRAFEIFSIPRRALTAGVKIKYEKKDTKFDYLYSGIPIIAIHGTHEFRSQDYANALDVMQAAGFLLHLHAARATLEKENEKVVVYGFSGVPEKKAFEALQLWNPQPEKNAVNILLFHQGLKDFLPFDDEMVATISLSDLPKGFDLIVDGHLHWHSIQLIGNCQFLLPGSTIITQMKSLECEKPKGICLYDTQMKKVEFLALPKQRKLFYHKIKFAGETPTQILEKISQLIENDLKEDFVLPPLVRLKLTGMIAKGYSAADVSLGDIEEKFSGRAILSISREFQQMEFRKKIEELRQQQKNKLSVAARGFEILEKNLQEAGFDNAFDVQRIFKLLEEGENDKVIEILLQKQ